MTDDLQGVIVTPPTLGRGDPYGDHWEAIWADFFDARHAEKTHGTRQVLVREEIEAGQTLRTRASLEAQSCAERVDTAFRAYDNVAYGTAKPFLTTREATAYCDFTRERGGQPPNEAAPQNLAAMLALVDELAALAADLWFAGNLDHFPIDEEPPDDD